MAGLPAGSLNERVAILARAVTAKRAGSVQGEWAVAFTRWASVKLGASRRAAEGGQAQALDDYEFRLRLDEATRTITTEHALRWRGRDYAIEGHPHHEIRDGYVVVRVTSHLAA